MLLRILVCIYFIDDLPSAKVNKQECKYVYCKLYSIIRTTIVRLLFPVQLNTVSCAAPVLSLGLGREVGRVEEHFTKHPL